MFNKKNYKKNGYMLNGRFKKKGYDWWWHSFTALDEEGKEVPFFIEYFIINPKISPDKATYGRLKEKPSYVMVKCGCWGENKVQINKMYKLDDVKITKAPYKLESNDFYASDELIKGNILQENTSNHPEYMSEDGHMEWELKINKEIAFNVGYGTSAILRKIKAFQMYWHAEGMKSEYEGYIILNGKKYTVSKDTCYGYADKNWGSNFTSPWVWLSSNNIYDNINKKKLNNTVFDIGGGRPKVYFIPFNRKLLGALYLEGKEYEFNFSKFWHPTKTKFSSKEEKDKIIWDVSQKCKGYLMETHIECYKKDMLFVNYESPDGAKRYSKLWNGGNGFGSIKLSKKNKLIADLSVKNVGCEYGEYDK